MDAGSWSSVIDEYISKKLEEKEKKDPAKCLTKAAWLDSASQQAKGITVGITHASKFTHGDVVGIGILASMEHEKENYLSTSNIMERTLDTVCTTASILGVANLLLLEVGGKKLIHSLKEGDVSPFAEFTKDKKQLEQWCNGFLQALSSKKTCSHQLAKQTYFPTGKRSYHLLSPLFASSLYHALHQRIDATRFGDEIKAARDAKRKKEFSLVPVVDFPSLAEQHFGGTKPQNVSLLNSKRKGCVYLMSCRPPLWKNRLTPPKSIEDFWRGYGYKVKSTTKELIDFLKTVSKRDNNASIKQHRAELVDDLVRELHNQAALLRRNLPQGWSQGMEKPMNDSWRYWLDPISVPSPPMDWTDQIGLSFGRWLNEQLREQLNGIGDIELNFWRRLLARELRLLKQDLEHLS